MSIHSQYHFDQDQDITRKTLEDERDSEAFDHGMKSLNEKGHDSLAEVKCYLGLNV